MDHLVLEKISRLMISGQIVPVVREDGIGVILDKTLLLLKWKKSTSATRNSAVRFGTYQTVIVRAVSKSSLGGVLLQVNNGNRSGFRVRNTIHASFNPLESSIVNDGRPEWPADAPILGVACLAPRCFRF